jgi:phosphoribosylanthranilate isomerase
MPAFRAVGVFVNEAADAMRDIVSFVGLDLAQIHGDESPGACAELAFPWYRALRVSAVADAYAAVGAPWGCDRLLIDSKEGGSYGGTGTAIGTWAALAAKAIARDAGKELFVAGGIKPRNVASVIHSLGPAGIDVSSGVEESPGRKSKEKLEALFHAVKVAARERAPEPRGAPA